MNTQHITSFTLEIPERELLVSYSRSSGPGGQNVNKVETKVTIKWNISLSPVLWLGIRQRFFEKFKNQINKDGFLVISSDKYRDQTQNYLDCIQKIQNMLKEVANPPQKRKATNPTKSSVKKRLESKKQVSHKKLSRQKYSLE